MNGEWILWKFDPCQEGGWRMACTYPTEAEAINAANVTHSEEEENHLRMVEFCKDPANGPPEEWPRSNACYQKCMVTGPAVYEIGWDEKGETQKRHKD